MREVTCPHSGEPCAVASAECGRPFVPTRAAPTGSVREYGDPALPAAEARTIADPAALVCDDDRAGPLGPAARVGAGRRQKTCPACHT